MSFECNFHGRKCMRVSKSLFSFIGYKPSSSRRMWFEGTFVRRRGGVLVLTTDVWLGVWPPATQATAPTDALQSPWLGWTFTWPDGESGCQCCQTDAKQVFHPQACAWGRYHRAQAATSTCDSCMALERRCCAHNFSREGHDPRHTSIVVDGRGSLYNMIIWPADGNIHEVLICTSVLKDLVHK